MDVIHCKKSFICHENLDSQIHLHFFVQIDLFKLSLSDKIQGVQNYCETNMRRNVKSEKKKKKKNLW